MGNCQTRSFLVCTYSVLNVCVSYEYFFEGLVAGENVRASREEIRESSASKSANHFYKYACIILCSESALILRGINILFSTVFKIKAVLSVWTTMVFTIFGCLFEKKKIFCVLNAMKTSSNSKNLLKPTSGSFLHVSDNCSKPIYNMSSEENRSMAEKEREKDIPICIWWLFRNNT